MSRSSRRRRRLRPEIARGLRRLGIGAGLVILALAAAGYPRWSRPAAPRAIPSTGAVEARPAAAGGAAERVPVAATPGSSVTPEQMQALSLKLQALVRKAPARMAAVYVQDIATGLTAAANPNQKFLAASLIKLPVMAAVYERWETNAASKNARTLGWIEQMITVSDNASTDRLIDVVGGPERVIRFCEERGWPNFRVRHAILNHRGRRGLNECTAREVTEFLVALDRRELVTAEADQEMWEVLCRQKKVARIPAGLPKLAGLEVGNKTGTLSNALHDAGIVRTGRARYALCILVSGQRSEYLGNRFCRQVSRLVFDTLHGPVEEPPVEEPQDVALEQ